jgi:hypothetical protein
MKKVMVGLAVVLSAGLVFVFTNADAQMMGGRMGSGMGWGQGHGSQYQGGSRQDSNGNRDYGNNEYGMGPGMMGGQGYGMGQGMMGPGYGSEPSRQFPNGAQQQPQQPIDKAQARSMVENYLHSTGNPNLKLGKITDDGSSFEADIVTKDNSMVDKILVDKNSGAMRSAY